MENSSSTNSSSTKKTDARAQNLPKVLPEKSPEDLPKNFQQQNRIAILDFGSQVTQLIARHLRQAGVYSRIFPYSRDAVERIEAFDPQGIVLSGGPKSLLEENTRIDNRICALEKPLLGICYGEQILCRELGGKLERAQDSEYGPAQLEIVEDCLLFDRSPVWIEQARVFPTDERIDKIASLPKWRTTPCLRLLASECSRPLARSPLLPATRLCSGTPCARSWQAAYLLLACARLRDGIAIRRIVFFRRR